MSWQVVVIGTSLETTLTAAISEKRSARDKGRTLKTIEGLSPPRRSDPLSLLPSIQFSREWILMFPSQPHTQGPPTFQQPSSRHQSVSLASHLLVLSLSLESSALPRPKQHLHSTKDLLAVFNLHSAYDKYVRPHVRAIGDPDPGKGKGKEKEVPSGDATHHQTREGEEEDAEKKKKKDSYRHLIKRTPGPFLPRTHTQIS